MVGATPVEEPTAETFLGSMILAIIIPQQRGASVPGSSKLQSITMFIARGDKRSVEHFCAGGHCLPQSRAHGVAIVSYEALSLTSPHQVAGHFKIVCYDHAVKKVLDHIHPCVDVWVHGRH